ncbi:helix-turn-helix domain-containing protein [Paenibacillus tianmuensis]|nr:helix-turn-helix domain-containing protein [Paenibacillus tianmuensis]
MGNTSKLEEVKQAMKKAKDRRMFERYQALYLHLQGTPAEAIAPVLDRSVKTYSNIPTKKYVFWT